MARTDRFDGILERGWNRFRTRLAGRIAALGRGEQIELAAETAGDHTTLVKIVALDARSIEVEMTGSAPRISLHVRPTRSRSGSSRHCARTTACCTPPSCEATNPTPPAHCAPASVRHCVYSSAGDPHRRRRRLCRHRRFAGGVRRGRRQRSHHPTLGALLHGISGRAQAAEELLELNRAWPHIKLLLVEDRLVATIDVMGDPFVPRHLIDLFGALRALLGTVDTGFAQRFDGERYTGDTDAEPTLFDEPTVFDEPS